MGMQVPDQWFEQCATVFLQFVRFEYQAVNGEASTPNI